MTTKAMIQQSLDYIEENLQTEITAAELAEEAGFSMFHYYRVFQSATGLPVMQYILRRRLLHAIYAIHQGSTKINAALLYGFDTYAGFYKAFCREFGCTPSEFLKSCRAKRPYRINLSKEEHMIVTHKKASQILKNWGLESETIFDIYYESTGEKHDGAYYVGDNYILKFTPNVGKLMNHTELSKAIKSVGLCAAVPMATVDGREYISDGELYYFVTPRLPGKPLVSGNFCHGAYARKAHFVGEIIGQLHLALSKVEQCVTDVNLLETIANWALPNAKRILGLDEEFCSEFLDAFTALYEKLPRQIIHRDPNPSNIICAEECWGFIDFELSEQNVRIYDPCYAATAILSENFENMQDNWMEVYHGIIQGYDSVIHLTEDERKALPYVILANQLVCVAWFETQEKYQDIFENNKLMTLWLLDRFEEMGTW